MKNLGGIVDTMRYKKITMLTCFLMILFIQTPLALAKEVNTFSDIEGHWAEEYIKELSTYNIVDGYPNGTFRPNDLVTREQFITMVLKAVKAPIEPVEGNTWWYPYYKYARDTGIFPEFYEFDSSMKRDEYGNVAFHIFREEMAMYAARATVLSNLDVRTYHSGTGALLKEYGTFWVKDSDVLEAVSIGLMGAKEDAVFSGQHMATRAEAAVVIMRMLDPSLRLPYDASPYQITVQSRFWNKYMLTDEIVFEIPETIADHGKPIMLDIIEFFDAERRTTVDGDVTTITPLFDIPRDKFYDYAPANRVHTNFKPEDSKIVLATSLGSWGTRFSDFAFIGHLNMAAPGDFPYVLELSKRADYDYYDTHYRPLLNYFYPLLFEDDTKRIEAEIRAKIDEIISENYTGIEPSIFELKNGRTVKLSFNDHEKFEFNNVFDIQGLIKIEVSHAR